MYLLIFQNIICMYFNFKYSVLQDHVLRFPTGLFKIRSFYIFYEYLLKIFTIYR